MTPHLRSIFDRLFSSVVWKGLVIVLYGLLFYWILNLVFITNQAVDLAFRLGLKRYPTISQDIYEGYVDGVVAVCLISVLMIAGLFELYQRLAITRQFRALAQSMLSFANGDLQARFDGQSSKEVLELGRAFNTMADTLKSLIEELRIAENQRKELQANVAHDLAGPLTSIAGYIDTISMLEKPPIAADKQKYFEIIKKNLQSLNRLVNKLSELEELDISEKNMKFERFSLYTLAYDVIARYATQAESKNIKMEIDTDNSGCIIFADPHLFERVLSNLVENSIRYTPASGKVTVRCKLEASNVILLVEDSGVGIPAKDLPFVFERFYRVDRDRSRNTGGSGLGLSIVKKIIDVHKGSITLTSSQGNGTRVRIQVSACNV